MTKPTRSLSPAIPTLPLYRVADGKIVTGREADGTLTEVPSITGEAIRVFVFRGELDSGEAYAKLEADIILSEDQQAGNAGETVSLSARPDSVAGYTYGLILATVTPGEVLRFRANRARKENKRGTFSTYVNADVKQGPGWLMVQVEDGGDYETPFPEKCRGLETVLEGSPLWAIRPDRSDKQPWEGLEDALTGTAWPALNAARNQYAEMAAKFGKGSDKENYDALASRVRANPDNCPPVLARPLEDYDPFADN